MEKESKRNLEKEYDFLRNEIMHHKNRQNSFSTFVCTSLIAVLGGAAITQEQWISLLGFLIIIPCALKTFESRYSISLISTYMCVYLEPFIGIRWESNLLQYYNSFNRSWYGRIVYRFSKYDYVFYSLGTSVFYWVILYHKIKTYLSETAQKYDYISIITVIVRQLHNRVVFLFQVILIVAILGLTYIYFDYKRLKQNRLRNWNELMQKQCLEKKDEDDRINHAIQEFCESQKYNQKYK